MSGANGQPNRPPSDTTTTAITNNGHRFVAYCSASLRCPMLLAHTTTPLPQPPHFTEGWRSDDQPEAERSRVGTDGLGGHRDGIGRALTR